jgi:hypothetical protein
VVDKLKQPRVAIAVESKVFCVFIATYCYNKLSIFTGADDEAISGHFVRKAASHDLQGIKSTVQ